MLTYMKCIQDLNLVTIIVNHNQFLTPNEFKLKVPIIVVDLSYQTESVKTGPIDVRISIELNQEPRTKS